MTTPTRPLFLLARFVAVVLLSAGSSALIAHDLWLQPENEPSRPGTILIRAVVSAEFPKREETKQAADYRAVRFVRDGTAISAEGFGEDATLLGRIDAGKGFYVAALGPTREIDLEASLVRGYLRDEAGLDEPSIASVLEGAGPKLHETYSRCLKSLILRSDAPAPVPSPRFDLPWEIELSRYERKGGRPRSLAFRLLKSGTAVPSASFRVIDSTGKTIQVRADDRGEARASVSATGPLLIAHVELLGQEKGRYQTCWTKLAIFELP